jgi:hypothetical protein
MGLVVGQLWVAPRVQAVQNCRSRNVPHQRLKGLTMYGRNISALALAISLLLGPAAGHAQERWVEGELFASSSRTDGSYSFYERTPFRHDFDDWGGDYSFGVASLASLASVRSTVGYGWARAVGTASAYSGTLAPGVGGVAMAQYDIYAAFSDTLTIDAPRLNGTQGRVQMGMVVDGILSSGADSNNDPTFPCCGLAIGYVSAVFRDEAGRRGEYSASVSSSDVPGADPSYAFIDEQFVGGAVAFTYGTPFQVRVSINLGGMAFAGLPDAPPPYPMTSAAMVGDFSHTLTWAGLSDLRDANGNPVEDFSVTSLSGTDYRFAIAAPPVPEPATALLWAAGLAALGCAARRRSG